MIHSIELLKFSMAQNGYCFEDIYLLVGINKSCLTRAPMWILDEL